MKSDYCILIRQGLHVCTAEMVRFSCDDLAGANHRLEFLHDRSDTDASRSLKRLPITSAFQEVAMGQCTDFIDFEPGIEYDIIRRFGHFVKGSLVEKLEMSGKLKSSSHHVTPDGVSQRSD